MATVQALDLPEPHRTHLMNQIVPFQQQLETLERETEGCQGLPQSAWE